MTKKTKSLSTKESTELKIISRSLLILTAIALAVFFYFARPLLVPFVFAIFLSYTMLPLIELLQYKVKMPRFFAVAVTILTVFGILTLIVIIVQSSIQGFIEGIGVYQETISKLIVSVTTLLEKLVYQVKYLNLADQIPVLPVGSIVQSTVASFASVLSNSFLIFIFVVYMISGRSGKKEKGSIHKKIDENIKRYISAKIGISAVTGILVGFSLWIIGLELAFVFGVLAFLLNFIPNIGSIVSTLLPIPFAIMQFHSVPGVLLVVLVPGGIQMLIGNYVEPKYLGKRLQLHPITVILSLVFWGMIWGIIGLFVAVPISAVFKIIFEQIEQTRPFARLMEGKLDMGKAK